MSLSARLSGQTTESDLSDIWQGAPPSASDGWAAGFRIDRFPTLRAELVTALAGQPGSACRSRRAQVYSVNRSTLMRKLTRGWSANSAGSSL